MESRKDPDFPVHRVVFIVVSFLLGLLDMTLLYRAFHDLTQLNNGMSMIISFIIATIANFTALTWGWENGRHLAKRTINKRTVGEFIIWLAIGIMYAVIRAINIINKLGNPELNWMGETIQIVILAISYIGTGVLIQSSAREIWDAECVAFRKARKKFNRLHEDVADASADLHEDIGILKKYNMNYSALEHQKNKIEFAIRKSEKAVMADIVSMTCAKNPMISPVQANKVMEQVLDSAGVNIKEPKDDK
jgi:hypothetical protein